MQTIQNSSPTESSDAELITRFASQEDEGAFSEIVRRYLPLVLAVTRRRLGNSGLAEDAAQQVFIALSHKLQNRRAIPCLAAWFQKAAVFEASTLARKEARHRRRAKQAEDFRPTNRSASNDALLDLALASLADCDRQILILHHLENLTFARVAGRLGITEAAAQRRGHRALEKLRSNLRSKGIERDTNACSLWLGASIVPAGISVSPATLKRISTLKHGAVKTLPWLPITAVIALAGCTWAVVAVIQPATPPPSSVAAILTERTERRGSQRLAPKLVDEKLRDDVREFISRAKLDSNDAWEWVKQRPEGMEAFFNQSDAVQALADRDLPAAERFLAAFDGLAPRGKVIDGIFASSVATNFESAILWVESTASPDDLRGVNFIAADYINSEWQDYDYAGALGFARLRKVREWLIRQACEKASAMDETRIEKLATGLKGNERQIALGYAASLLLQRGDSRAYELLDELKPDLWNLPDVDKAALRDPRAMLDWLAAHDDAKNRDKIGRSVWHSWSSHDATAAAAWVRNLDSSQRRELGVSSSLDATTERLLNQP